MAHFILAGLDHVEDAEGRLVLADALALADEDDPDLVISMATLTGAARVALGPDLPATFANDEALDEVDSGGRKVMIYRSNQVEAGGS